jgi:hypothetical protein
MLLLHVLVLVLHRDAACCEAVSFSANPSTALLLAFLLSLIVLPLYGVLLVLVLVLQEVSGKGELLGLMRLVPQRDAACLLRVAACWDACLSARS